MKIALVSLNQVWEDKKANLDLGEKYIQKASNENECRFDCISRDDINWIFN